MTESEYRAAVGWNYSALKLLPDQPELFYGRHITNEFPFKPTPAMEIGTILHAAVLLDDPLPIIPADVLNADGHRKGAAWTAYKTSHPGPLLTEAEAEPLGRMVAAVNQEPKARWLLDHAVAVEESIFWTDADTRVLCKARLDAVCEFGEQLVVVDLKTTSDPSEAAFAKSLYNFAYHRQAAWYLDAAAKKWDVPEGFCFVAVRNEPPYECRVYELSPRAIELGRDINRRALADLNVRLETNDWNGPAHGRITVVDLPEWAHKIGGTFNE